MQFPGSQNISQCFMFLPFACGRATSWNIFSFPPYLSVKLVVTILSFSSDLSSSKKNFSGLYTCNANCLIFLWEISVPCIYLHCSYHTIQSFVKVSVFLVRLGTYWAQTCILVILQMTIFSRVPSTWKVTIILCYWITHKLQN